MIMFLGDPIMSVAQQFRIEEFEQVHKPLLRPTPGRSKEGAVVEYTTIETGFQFKIAGELVAPSQEDNVLSVVVPKGSSFIEISHPNYGVVYWKAPMKLKRKRVYRALLTPINPKSEYQITKQWAVVDIAPKDSIVKIDTIFHKVRNGVLQLFLPIGSHPIEIHSPFYNSIYDTLVVERDLTARVRYELRPIYSYIEVVTPNRDVTLSIDGVEYPRGELRSGRLLAGKHIVGLSRDGYKSEFVEVELGEGDRRVVDIGVLRREHKGGAKGADEQVVVDTLQLQNIEQAVELKEREMVRVSLRPFDDECEVLINREVVGRGEWSGELPYGGYYFMSRRDGLESRSIYYEVGGKSEIELKLPTPLAYYGKLNIGCNVVGAKIYLNGELVGLSPLIIHNLESDVSYDVELRKEGYKSKRQRVKLRGNVMTTLDFEMKR